MAKVTGIKLHTGRLRKMAASQPLLQRALFVAGDMVKVEAQSLINEGSISGAGHQVSAPGTAPNNDTGGLRDSIQTVVVGPNRVNVEVNTPWAHVHEFGSSTHPERPFMAPAARRKTPEAIALIKRAVAQSTK